MRWIATSDLLPTEEALVLVDGAYHVAVLVGDDAEDGAAFMDVHSSDLLPWPSHWMSLPPGPAVQRARLTGRPPRRDRSAAPARLR